MCLVDARNEDVIRGWLAGKPKVKAELDTALNYLGKMPQSDWPTSRWWPMRGAKYWDGVYEIRFKVLHVPYRIMSMTLPNDVVVMMVPDRKQTGRQLAALGAVAHDRRADVLQGRARYVPYFPT